MYPSPFDATNLTTSSTKQQHNFPQPPPGGRRVLVGDSASRSSPIVVVGSHNNKTTNNINTTAYIDIPPTHPFSNRNRIMSAASDDLPHSHNNNMLPNQSRLHQQQRSRTSRNIVVGCISLLVVALLLLTIFWPMGRGGDHITTGSGDSGGGATYAPPKLPSSSPKSSGPSASPSSSANQQHLQKVALSPDFNYYKDFDRSLSDPHKLYANTTELIIVAGHSVFTGSNWKEWALPSNWAFEPFQRREGAGEVLVSTYNQHILRGMELLTGLKSVDACRKSTDAQIPSSPSSSSHEGENQHQRRSNMATYRSKEIAPSTDPEVIKQRRRDLQTRLLIFSGGASRQQAGPRTEGTSYYQLAEVNNYYGLFGDRYTIPSADTKDTNKSSQEEQSTTSSAGEGTSTTTPTQPPPANTMYVDDNDYTENGDAIKGGTPFAKRFIATEDFARDSYENLLFSVYRFREVTGRFPLKVTVVGYEYKRRRFTDVHRAAMRIPLEMFQYVGIDSLEAELLNYEKRTEAVLRDRFEVYQENGGGYGSPRKIPPAVLERYAHAHNITASSTPDSFFDVLHPPPNANDDNSNNNNHHQYRCAQSNMISSHYFAPPKKKSAKAKKVDGGEDGGPPTMPLPWVYALSDEATVNYVKKDPYLCVSNMGTRRVRNPLRRTPPYYLSAPPGAARELLGWCGPEMFPNKLPWSSSSSTP